MLLDHCTDSTEIIVATSYLASREAVPYDVEKALPNMMAGSLVNTIDKRRGEVWERWSRHVRIYLTGLSEPAAL